MNASPMLPFDRWLTVALEFMGEPLTLRNETHLAAVLLARMIDGYHWRHASMVACELIDGYARSARCSHVFQRLRRAEIMLKGGVAAQPQKYDDPELGRTAFVLDALVGGGELLCIRGRYITHPAQRVQRPHLPTPTLAAKDNADG